MPSPFPKYRTYLIKTETIILQFSVLYFTKEKIQRCSDYILLEEYNHVNRFKKTNNKGEP